MRRFLVAVFFALAGCVGVADYQPGGDDAPTGDSAPNFGDGAHASDPGSDFDASTAGGLGGDDAGDAGDFSEGPDAGTPDSGGGAGDPCAALACGQGSHCDSTAPAHCVCDPGFVPDGGGCVPGDPGIPELRTAQQVCAGYKAGLATTSSANSFSTASTAMCDPGSLSQAAFDDAFARLNMYRWLVGLGPVSDDPSANQSAQECALISAWNTPGPQAHAPSSSSTCYTPTGAGGAGSSNIAWGPPSPADAIDQWFVDWGNETTFGHRRWLLHPSLGKSGFGFYVGGNQYGTASCITVFDGSGSGPQPSWFAFPPPGFSPEPVTQMIWTLHGDVGANLDGGVIRESDGAQLPVDIEWLGGSYGGNAALAINRPGWNPVAGEVYRVHVEGSLATYDYEVKPVTCP